MQLNPWALTGIVLVGMVTFYLGHRSSRFASSTHDFLVARRTVRSRRNAAAISGEYLSAASFLGVAGSVLKEGADALWFPIGFTAGYLALMLFVAAPLRRSGAYTLPDFLEARLGSMALRRFSTAFVVFIGILYMVPQLQGAGLGLTTILGTPAWAGAVVVTVVVTTTVIAGGMRAITVVQAFQYWLKLFAIAAPTFVLCVVFIGGGAGPTAGSLGTPAPPVFTEETTVDVQTSVELDVAVPTVLYADGMVDGMHTDGVVFWSPEVQPEVGEGTKLRFPAGSPVPVVSGALTDNATWLLPASGDVTDLLSTYSLMFATFLGTMGLPHVLVRFYTNPDGKAARRTTVHVLLLLGLFYLFTLVLGYGAGAIVGKDAINKAPGKENSAAPLLAQALGGPILLGFIAAVAFATILAVVAGLTITASASFAHDVYANVIKKGKVSDSNAEVRVARITALVIGAVAIVGGLLAKDQNVAFLVALAFAVAASANLPTILYSLFWKRFNTSGALWSIYGGLGVTVVLIIFSPAVSGLSNSMIKGVDFHWFPLQNPGLVSIPVSFFLGWLGTVLSKEHNEDKYAEMEVRSPTGAGAEKAVPH